MANKKLTRSRKDRVISGVCGGLANYFGLDTVIIRVAFLVAFLGAGTGLLLYLILWVVMPNE